MAVFPRALCPVLVGREAELAGLENALLAARRGEGSVVILGGEAGMGKTRLASELMREARRLGSAVMSGSCTEAEVALPYLPFIEAIGNHLRTVDLHKLEAELGPAAVELGQLFPQLGQSPAPAGDAVQSKLRLFESILLLLTKASGIDGLLLVLEDLHWADPATRELLDYLTRRLRATNILILATYRTEELHRKHALLPTIQGWRRSGSVQVIDVPSLEARSIGDMLCAIFDEQEVSEEFQEFIRERTEGNPFVVEEMLKEALDRGDIFRTETGWDRKALRELRVPPTVRDGILIRVERLPEADAHVLSAAAVVGRSFDVDVIAAAAQMATDDVLDSVQRCVLHQLVEEDEHQSGTYRFRHALTREAIYEDMVTPRRQQLHGRVVDVLAAQGRPTAELAHHLLLARRTAEAVAMCGRAAEEAAHALAYSDAAGLLERAAPLIADPAERGRFLCRAGDARWNNTEAGLARRLLEEGVASLEQAGAFEEAAGYRVLLGRCHWELNRSDLARREFEAALATLEPLGPSEALATVHVRLAGLAQFNDRDDEALARAQQAEAVARAANSERALAWAWIFQGGAVVGMGEVERGFELFEQGYKLAQARGFWFQAGNATFNSAWIAVHLGLGRRARAWSDRITRDLPPGSLDTWIGYVQGLCLTYGGRVAEALPLVREALERCQDSGQEKTAWRCRVLIAHILAEMDRGDEALATLPPESTRVDRQDEVYDGAARIRTALAIRDRAAAAAAAARIHPEGCALASPGDAVAQVLLDDPERVRAFVRAMPGAGETRESPRFLAMLGFDALAAGDLAVARVQLERSIEASRTEGAMLDVWHNSLPLARVVLRQNDQAGVKALLQSVIDEAGAADALLVQRLAVELAAELGVEIQPPAPPTQAAPVEPRLAGERLVTVLFADIRGYTATSAASAPADTVERVAAFHRWATDSVHAHHGVVDKFAGDAIMATFNISGSSVDHAAHAVACGREILQKAAAAGLPVGVGIATGPAVVGRLTKHGNLSVLGTATNLASRLQSSSAAGQLTLSAETHRRLPADGAVVAEQVELDLKGIEQPVTAYRLAVTGG